MKRSGVLTLVLTLMVCVSLSAQYPPKMKVAEKGLTAECGSLEYFLPDSENLMQAQGAGEKCFLITTEIETVDEDVMPLLGMVKMGAGEVHFFAYMASFANQKVRYHFIFTGPSFEYVVTDWGTFRKYEAGFGWVGGNRNEFKKGMYKLVVVAESNKTQSGPQLVGEYNVWFY